MKQMKPNLIISGALLLAAAYILLLLPSAYAQRPGEVIETGPAKVGTASAQFLQIGVSARAASMAEAFVAVADDASATYYNPAGISNVSGRELFVSNSNWFADINHYFGAYVNPLGGLGVVGVSFIVLSTDDMPVRKPFIGETGENFRASDAALGLTYAKYLTDKFSAGGTIKWINETYYKYTANVFAADIGTYYNTDFRNMVIGMAVTNFGPDFHFSRDETEFIGRNSPLPINFRFGIALSLFDTGTHSLLGAFDVSQPNDNLRRENLGFEYVWNKTVALRGGYKAEYDAEDFSLGAGVKGKFSGKEIGFDFSWSNLQYLGAANRFSFIIDF